MIAIDPLLTFMLASALLSIAPGPDNIFVLTQAALYGRKAGILVTLGLCTGLMVHTTAVALGMAAIFQHSALAFNALKMAGAAYLIYLAWQAFRASASHTNGLDSRECSSGELYRRGIIMNITNPKVTIFFLAFLPQFASLEHGALAAKIFVLGGLFILIALLIFSAIAIASGALGIWLNGSPKAQVFLNRIAGLVFVALALKLAFATQGI